MGSEPNILNVVPKPSATDWDDVLKKMHVVMGGLKEVAEQLTLCANLLDSDKEAATAVAVRLRQISDVITA